MAVQGDWETIEAVAGDVVFSSSGRPCIAYIDVMLACHRADDVACLVFQNDYAASICIEQPPPGVVNASADVYNCVLPLRRLMRHAHCEDDARAWHAVYRTDFVRPLELDVQAVGQPRVKLRMQLSQPSPNWPTFGLRHIRAHRFVPRSRAAAAPAGAPRALMGLLGEVGEKTAELRRRSRAEGPSQEEGAREIHRLESRVQHAAPQGSGSSRSRPT